MINTKSQINVFIWIFERQRRRLTVCLHHLIVLSFLLYKQENNKFIFEWSRVRKLAYFSGKGSVQIISIDKLEILL